MRLNRPRDSRKRHYDMCDKKRKFKSSEASRMASKFNQRKYECPACGGWHLTKKEKYVNESSD